MAQDMGRGIMAPENNEDIGTGASEMRTLAASAAIAVGDAAFKRGVLSEGTDANSLVTPGQYYTGGASVAGTHSNLASSRPSDILVVAGDGTYSVTQFQIPSSTADYSIYYRSKITGSLWSNWMPINTLMGQLALNTDLDNLHRPGFYQTGPSANAQTMSNLAVVTASNILVMGSGTTSFTSQMQIPVTGTGAGLWVRSRRTASVWGPWVNLAASGGDRPLDSGHYGVPNVQRIEDFKAVYPLVSTGGKGVVSFRWDHGLTNFKNHVLPLHQSLGLPCIIAMNSRNWDATENSGMSQAEAATLAQAGLVEWANHTADHQDRDTEEGLYDNIVNGRIELESQLGIPIHHFIIPGASPSGLGGLITAPNLDRFSQTYAGSLVLAYHAVSSGNFSGTQMRALDGRVKQGQSHYGIDTRSVAEVKAQIDQAVTQKRALWLMGHPDNLGRSGYLTASGAQEIMQYVKQLIDAGELANITPNQTMHATL